MIYLGLQDKRSIVLEYMARNNITKLYSFGEKIGIDNEDNTVKKNLIEYDFYNRLRSQISQDDLIVINELLFTSKRTDLTYNCVRQYVVQTKHRLIFQKYPFHNSEEDLAILYDFLQNNPFLKTPWQDIDIQQFIAGCNLPQITMRIDKITLPDDKVKQYEAEKEQIFRNLKPSTSPSVLPKQCLRAAQKINTQGDDKAVFLPDGHYFESQLGVDRYFCDILRTKAAIVEKYNGNQKIHG